MSRAGFDRRPRAGRGKRRAAGLLGLLWTSGAVKVVAVGTAITMLVTSGGDGTGGLADEYARERAAQAQRQTVLGATPQQQWGAASGGGDQATQGKPGNRTLPASVRSRYPAIRWEQNADNAASVVDPPASEVRGFDEATSTEVAAQRGAFERVYDNTDGTQTTVFSTTPVNYQDANGAWQPIDTTLRPAEQGGGWRNTADAVGLHFAPTATTDSLATVRVDDAHALSFGLAETAATTATTEGSAITYPGVLSHVDLKLEAQPGGVKETLVLTAPDAPTSFVFPLRLTGLTASLVDGQVVLTDAAGTPRAVLPPGEMVDSRTGDAGPAASTGVSYQLVTSGGQQALRVDVDAAWLRDPARVYPVLVDPTVRVPVAGEAADSSMYTVQGGSSVVGRQTLRVGAGHAAYVKFTGLVNKLKYHTIFGAQLWAVNYNSNSCTPRQVTVHPVTESWSAGTGYSYPGPSVGGELGSKSFNHGYIAFGKPSSACPTAGELIDLGGGGRDLVQRWVNGEQANNGISLRASTDASAGKWFTGTETANPPRLYVTHSPYNASYSIPNPVPNPVVLQNQDGKVKVTVTNKSAAEWQPGDYYLAYRVYKADTGASVSQQRAANLTSTVARGGRVTLDATIKAMPPGKYFLDFTMVKTGGPVFTDHQVPPGRIVLQVFDIPPVVQELFPPNGYQAPTLTPQLWARALDIDAPPSVSMQFKFEVCQTDAANKPVNCVNSGYQAKPAWTVPAGTLVWSKTYQWRAYVKDATNEVISPYSTVLTSVPQPEITAHLAGSPYAAQDQEFDPQVGNVTTSALDASVTTVGPELNLVRTYNSLDPRRDGLFGAGWTSRYDMKLVPDNDGSGNVVVTYPDGQAVRFGRNPDGGYAAPRGRTASLTADASSWKLLDASGTTFQFSLNGRLTRITDSASRSVVLSYGSADGRLAKAQVSNSQTNTAGRSLTFTWSGNHVSSVSTDKVEGVALTWTYSYTGDLLTKVCGPGATACTSYDYSAGSHYRSAVLDSRPESYWRLGEPDGTAAASEVAVNLGKDAGSYSGVSLGTAGPLAGTTNTAATFDGKTSKVDIPKGTVKKSTDAAVELWFRSSITGTGGPLLGYQDKALGSASTTGVPVLYVGTDGKLRGQFATGGVNPITSTRTVNDGKWHHAVLSAVGTTQTLYLDGVKTGELTGKTVDQTLLTFNQIGAAYASSPASWPAWGSTAQRSFAGAIDEVAVYAHPLGAASVASHYQAGTGQADQLGKVTLPSGKTAVTATYDVATDRVKEYTDDNGGTWKIGAPTVYGGDSDLRRSVEVLDPANRPSLYEYDAIGGWLLREGRPLGIETRPEDRPGEPTTTPEQPPVQSCTQPDPNDPAFCTTIPDSSGGPVFVRYGAEGTAIRTFGYDDNGNLTTITDENGDTTTLTYDARGNVTSQRTCRTSSECHTSYTSYPATVTNPYDPRNNLPTETRDARSASATDNTYRTSYGYHATGQLATQTNPDGSTVTHAYTTGGEAAVNGGNPPAGLLASTRDARGKVTSYAYYNNGDLARITSPSGQITEYGYDAIGRRISEKQISDTFPDGVVTTYAYDTMSRLRTQTEPATRNAVTGQWHQRVTTNTYDVDGNATRVEVSDALGDAAARVTTSDYDEHNRMIRVTNPEGGETNYNYDAFGNVTSETDPNGNRFDYAYTARNDVSEVRLRDWHSDPAGTPAPSTGDHLVLAAYSYDFAGRLASETDAMGRRVEYEYYGDGLVHRVVLKNFHNPDGSTRDFVLEDDTYDADGNLTRQVADNGRTVVENTIDRVGRVQSTVADPGGLARTTSFTYDGNGNVLSVSRSGNASNVPWAVSTTPEQVTYEYDNIGNVSKETVTDGSTARITTYGYDQRGVRTWVTDPRGNDTGADRAAFTTRIVSDELGRRTSVIGAPVAVETGGGAASTTTPTLTTGYNAFGEQTDVRDETGNVSTASYDRLGRQVSSTAPSYTPPAGMQALTSTVRYDYDDNGNVIQVTDARGNTTRSSYDQLNRLTAVDQPASTDAERAVTSYTYTRTGQQLSTTDANGARTEATYDDLDRQVTSTEIERKPTGAVYTTTLGYDDAGNLTSSLSPAGASVSNTYDALGELIRSVDGNGVATEYGYDFAGRRVRATDGAGRTEQTAYNPFGDTVAEADLKADGTTLRSTRYDYDPAGNLILVTDPVKATTSYTYDAANQLVKQVETVTDTRTVTTTFGYDAAGHRTRYTDGRGNTTITTYNPLGLAESVIEPATTEHPAAADRTWTASYDQNGNQVALTAPGGVVRKASYDAANRLTSETGSGAEADTATRTLGYDLVGQLTSANGATDTNTYSYDDRGNLIGTTGPSGTAQFGYDGDGAPTSRTDAAGSASYGYTKGRLSTVVDGLTGATQKFGYDPAGKVRTIDYGSGRLRTLGYDDFGRLASDTLTNAAKQTVAATTVGYDLNDTLTHKTTSGTAGAGEFTYSYDKAGRLTGLTTGGTTTAYEWDDAGNRTRAGAKTASFDERNRVLADGDYTYTHTARGTLRTRTSSGLTEQFTSDAFDRMVSAAGQNYTYDGLDRVAARNGVAFTYAGQDDEPVADGTETYARGPGNELLAVGENGGTRLSIQDFHGDVVGAIDPADTTLSALAGSTAYDPFGTVTARTGDTGSLGFQGDWTDGATGQVDMGARWYDPGTGAFTSRDTLSYDSGDSVEANRYTYGSADPLDNVDPDGHKPRKANACNIWFVALACMFRHGGGDSTTVQPCWMNVFCSLIEEMEWNSPSSLAYAIEQQAYYQSCQVKKCPKKARGANGTYPSYAPGPAARNGSGRSCGACYGSGKSAASAAAARRAAYERAKRVSDVARSAAATAARTVPRKVAAAAAKPVLNMPAPVSSSPKLPARSVATNKNVVADARKGTEKIYQAAVDRVGPVVSNVSDAASAASESTSSGGGGRGYDGDGGGGFGDFHLSDLTHAGFWKASGRGFVHALAELSGYNDAKDCITDGDAEGCAWAAVTALSLLVGPEGAGAVRGVRSGVKEAVRHADDAVDAARVGIRAADAAITNVTCAAAGNSFTGDTPVRLADGGSTPIARVAVGDEVLATDPTTGRTEAEPVTDVITGTGRKDLTELTLRVTDEQSTSDTATITATSGHPFWSVDQSRWVSAGELRVGQRVRTAENRPATVVATRTWSQTQTVYNLTVDTLHTFHVVAGDADVLVHNVDGRCVTKALARARGAAAGGLSKIGSGLSRLGDGLASAGRTIGGGLSKVGRQVKQHGFTDPIKYVRNNPGRAAWRCIGMPALTTAAAWATLGEKFGWGAAAVSTASCVGNLVHDSWPTKK